MCKPLLPLIKDEAAHLFWKARHMATVHHHHGDHHAQYEIATATHKKSNENHNAASKLAEPVSVHLVTLKDHNFLKLSIAKQKFGVVIYKLSTLSLSKHYPPPKSC